MKKSLSFIILSLIAFLAVFSFIPKSVLADGMMIKPDPYSDRWDYSDENNQQAFINYDNGLQKMIISVGLEGENSKGIVWLFPVPSDPNKVAIDVVKSLLQLSGEEISKKAKSNLDDTTKFLQITQIYTIPFVFFFQMLSAVSTGDESFDNALGAPQGIGKGTESDVVVYEHLEKEGIASEIITAKTANGLYDYLKSKGLKIDNGSIPVLNNYIGKEYSFIASWISSPEKIISAEDIKNNLYIYFSSQYRYQKFFNLVNSLKQKYPELAQVDTSSHIIEFLQSQQGGNVLQEITQAIQNDPSIIVDTYLVNQRGVFVTFPTKEIYFPLLPTSVYGSKTVPATIKIIGHVSPKVFQDIKSYTKTDYYIDSYAIFADDLKNFYSGQNQNIKYTKIEINAPSKFLTDDLWINNQAPVKTYYSTFVAKHPIVSAIILFILSSILAGILAGLIIFKDLRKKPVKLGFLGLSNFLTLFGLLITTVLVGTKNKNESIEPLLAEIKQKGYFWKRRVATILFFVTIPFLIFGLFELPSMIRKIGYSIYFDFMDLVPVLIIYVLPTTALIVSFIIKRIKSEDKNLFEQLKLAGYSSWSFQSKDKMKYVFVPVFSVSFLIISWLLVKLVGFTV